MIVKVQLSVVTMESERQVLVYTQSRQYSTQLPLSACPGLEEALNGAPRAYFKAKIVGTKLELGKRMPDLGW